MLFGGYTMSQIRMIEDGIHDIPLMLSESLEPQRDVLHHALINAQRRLRDFACRNEWDLFLNKSFAQRFEIYDNQNEFIQALLRIAGADASTDLPETISAVLEENILMSVSPEVYSQIYPEGMEDRSFEKLITHEMAHRLHIRILGGNEDAMGPVWFFEGFAILAAGQFEDASMQPDDIMQIVTEKKRGSYMKYGALLRYFLTQVSIKEMVKRATDKDFVEWLRECCR